AAARTYFNKTLDELSLAQMALLAGLPKAPSRYSPFNNPDLARQRRAYVLARLRDTGVIDQQAYKHALDSPVKIRRGSVDDDDRFEADYLAEMARQYMLAHYGEKAYTAGYNVYLTIDSKRQRAARHALRQNLLAYDARHQWRGAQVQLNSKVLT